MLCRSSQSRGERGLDRSLPAYTWARSRRANNRARKAMHGNIGEAANILAANVTSLPGAWKAMRLEEADLLIFQEVRMETAALRKLAADARYQVVHGAEVEGEILVAVMARQGHLTKLTACPSGRAHHCRWQMGGQHVCIRNGYYQGGTQGDRDAADQVLAEWLEAAEETGEPTLIAGDFNATQAELSVSRWFAAAGWQELGGLQQPPTCLPSRGQPRRIDWLLASAGLLPAIRGLAEVRWDLGVKPHAVQTVKVDLAERRTFPKWHKATPLAPLMTERAWEAEVGIAALATVGLDVTAALPTVGLDVVLKELNLLKLPRDELLPSGAAVGEASEHAICIHWRCQEVPLARHRRRPVASMSAGRSCRLRGSSACRLHPLRLAGAAACEVPAHAAYIQCRWQDPPC